MVAFLAPGRPALAVECPETGDGEVVNVFEQDPSVAGLETGTECGGLQCALEIELNGGLARSLKDRLAYLEYPFWHHYFAS